MFICDSITFKFDANDSKMNLYASLLALKKFTVKPTECFKRATLCLVEVQANSKFQKISQFPNNRSPIKTAMPSSSS